MSAAEGNLSNGPVTVLLNPADGLVTCTGRVTPEPNLSFFVNQLVWNHTAVSVPAPPVAAGLNQRENDMTSRTQEFQLRGDTVLGKLKELVHEGDIRRITIQNEDGHTLIEIPLTIGVVGALLLPVWAAVGAIAALVAHLTLVVERTDELPPVTPEAPPVGSTVSK